MPLVPDLPDEAAVSDLILFRFLCTSYDTTDTSDTNDTNDTSVTSVTSVTRVASVTNLIGNTLLTS
jgi:hypothetical protein